MTSPYDPQGRPGESGQPDQARPGPYGQPTTAYPLPGQNDRPGVGQAGQQPGQPGHQQYGQPPGPYGAPPPSPGGPPAYNPYGAGPSYAGTSGLDGAGLGDSQPVRRPGSVVLALILFILSALPYLIFGAIFAIFAGNAVNALPPEALTPFQNAGIDPATFLLAAGLVFVVPALIYILLAILAFRGSNGGRIAVTVLTVIFVLGVVGLVVAGLTGAASAGGTLSLDVTSSLILFGPAVLAVIGVILLFGGAANRFFRGPRR